MEEWKRIHPGGKTKEEFEKGELTQDGEAVSTAKLDETFRKVRKIKAEELRASEKAKETSKSPEEIEFIGMVQMMISKERERLGLPPGYFTELEETRLFHPDQWPLRKGHSDDVRGQYRTLEGLAESQTPNKGSEASPYAYFRTTSHEILHQASYHEADPLGSGGMRHRVGYLTYADGLGLALNEAMTEGINQQLLTEHGEMLGSRFPEMINGKPYRWWSEFSTYVAYRRIVEHVAKKVDEALYGGVSTTWDNLERGYFEGDRKALEDIEKAVGKEPLELLLLLGNRNLFNTSKEDNGTSYFNIERQIERLLMDEPSWGHPSHVSPAQKNSIYRFVMKYRKEPERPVGGNVVNK